MPGSIFYCGDLHGGFEHLGPAVREHQPAAVVLLGDMTPDRPLEAALDGVLATGVPLYWIPGNHDADDDTTWRHVWGSALEAQNIHGRVVELPNGQRLAGLGGVFRGAVWQPSNGGSPAFRSMREHTKSTPRQERWGGTGPNRKHWGTIYPEQFEQLAKLRADVLVTHEAPGYHPHGFAVLSDLARALCVRVALHGHHHDALDSSSAWPTQGFRSYGVGLRGITAIDAAGQVEVIAVGEEDERHARERTLKR